MRLLLEGMLNARVHGFVVLVAILTAGCSSTPPLLPGAAQVKLTRIRADIDNCRELGTVVLKTPGAFTESNVVVDQLRNQTVQLGGNTIFVLDDRAFTPSGVAESGMAYLCP